VRIAEACGSTPGAVSKRWSRLKKTIEQGDAPPSTAAASSTKKTPSKGKAKAEGNDDTPPVTPKRKRGSKAVCGTDSGDEEDGLEPKKAKATPKSKPRPKTAFRASDKKKASSVKTEPEDEVEDVFTDAHEHLALASSLKAESDLEEVCKSCNFFLSYCTLSSALTLMILTPSSTSLEVFVYVRETADMFLNRIDFGHSTDVVNKQA
jgi:hypothetical protein